MLRNAALAPLELPGQALEVEKVYELPTDDQVRAGVMKKAIRRDASVLERAVELPPEGGRRAALVRSAATRCQTTSLPTFWSEQWDEVPAELSRVTGAVRAPRRREALFDEEDANGS